MQGIELQHPTFAEEALPQEQEAAERQALLDAVSRLPDALGAPSPPGALRAQLLSQVAAAPERYAPLTRKVSELYDISREKAWAVLQQAAQPRAWKSSGLPGISKLRVPAGQSHAAAQAYLVRFAAGAHFPEHRHAGLETVLILSGSYVDSSGHRYRTGDLHLMEPGTTHAFTIDADEPCVAATLLHGGLNFRSLPLRWLARLLGH